MALIINLIRLSNAYDNWTNATTELDKFNAQATMNNRVEYIHRKYGLSPRNTWNIVRALRNPLPRTIKTKVNRKKVNKRPRKAQ
jgi:hypothetical protein